MCSCLFLHKKTQNTEPKINKNKSNSKPYGRMLDFRFSLPETIKFFTISDFPRSHKDAGKEHTEQKKSRLLDFDLSRLHTAQRKEHTQGRGYRSGKKKYKPK